MADPSLAYTEAQRRRQQAFGILVSSPAWPPILQELLTFSSAPRCENAEVRAGRMDVIGYILRGAGGTGNLDTNGVMNG